MGFENNITVSLVDVSLSTEIELKVSSIFSDKSLFNIFGFISQSINIYDNIVAMLGLIIPEPFANP